MRNVHVCMVHRHARVHTRSCLRTCICMYMHSCARAHTHTHVHTHTQIAYKHTHTHMYTLTHIRLNLLQPSTQKRDNKILCKTKECPVERTRVQAGLEGFGSRVRGKHGGQPRGWAQVRRLRRSCQSACHISTSEWCILTACQYM